MKSANIIKNVLGGCMVLMALNACAIVDKKDSDDDSNWFVRMFEKDGNEEASLATVAYSHGDFKKAEELVHEALKANPRNQQALLVGALTAEKTGRLNRARQYYEDLIIIGGDQMTILGTNSATPEKIADIAKRQLRMLEVKQSELVIENKNGVKSFNISKESGAKQSSSAIKKAWKKKPASAKKKADVGALFNQQEQNIISRFLALKELAEKDLITQEEFLTRRQANIGGLLPLTHTPGGIGIDEPVPSPDLIIERIEVLKEAVENRAITPNEFSAERDTIIVALLNPNPRARLKPKAPARDIFGAAKDLRKLEALYDLNLITSKEKEKEKAAIEKYLGINKSKPAAQAQIQPKAAPAQTAATIAVAPAQAPSAPTVTEVKEVSVVQTQTAQAPAPEPVNLLLQPQVQTNTIEKVEVVRTVPVSEVKETERYKIDGTVSITPEKTSAAAPASPNVTSPF